MRRFVSLLLIYISVFALSVDAKSEQIEVGIQPYDGDTDIEKPAVVSIVIGNLLNKKYIKMQRDVYEAILDGTQDISRASDLENVRVDSFKTKVWINNGVVYDDVVVSENTGKSLEIRVKARNRFFFLAVEFPEDGACFRGIIDTRQGCFIYVTKPGEVDLKQSDKPFIFQ